MAKSLWATVVVTPLAVIDSWLLFGPKLGLVVIGYALLAITAAVAVYMPVSVIAAYRKGVVSTLLGPYERKDQPVAFAIILLIRLLIPPLLMALTYNRLLDLRGHVV